MPISKILFLAEGTAAGSQNGSTEKLSRALLAVKSELRDVRGFISTSVKWRPKGKFLVNRSENPSMLGKDAPALSVHGEPQLAQSIEKAAEATGLWAEATDEWGLDPGHWHPLSLLSPEGNLMVVPTSLSQMSPEAHRKWGVAVRRGTQKWPEPLALVVTGSLSYRTDLNGHVDQTLNVIRKFDDEIVRMLSGGTIGELDDMDKTLFKAAQPEGGWGSLYFLWGALGENIPGSLHYYERPSPGVGSAAFLFNL